MRHGQCAGWLQGPGRWRGSVETSEELLPYRQSRVREEILSQFWNDRCLKIFMRVPNRIRHQCQYCYYLLDVQPNLFGRRSSSSVSIRTVCQTLPIKRMSMSRT